MKAILKILIILIVLSGQAFAQIAYYGTDTSANHSAKVTMTNLAIRSEEFSNAAWTKDTLTGATADTVVAPDGATTGDTITLSAVTSSGRFVYLTSGTAVTTALNYRYSIYAKGGTHCFISLFSQTPSGSNIDVNICTGAILRTGGSNISSSVTSVGNGWYLIDLVFLQSGTTTYLTITPLKDASTVSGTSWVSAGTETFYLWGAGIQLASLPADYLATTTASATLGPLCGKGYAQSLINPSKCYPLLTYPILGADTITASALATDAVNEIREGILTRVVEGNYGATTIGGYIERIKNYVANKMVKSGSTYTIYKNDESTVYQTGTTNGAGRDPS